MSPSSDRPEQVDDHSLENQSEDAARLEKVRPRPAWETRQPAQVTKADVEQAKARPDEVTPPARMGESQGAAS